MTKNDLITPLTWMNSRSIVKILTANITSHDTWWCIRGIPIRLRMNRKNLENWNSFV